MHSAFIILNKKSISTVLPFVFCIWVYVDWAIAIVTSKYSTFVCLFISVRLLYYPAILSAITLNCDKGFSLLGTHKSRVFVVIAVWDRDRIYDAVWKCVGFFVSVRPKGEITIETRFSVSFSPFKSFPLFSNDKYWKWIEKEQVKRRFLWSIFLFHSSLGTFSSSAGSFGDWKPIFSLFQHFQCFQ